jgi:hypothetical protein
MNLLWAASGAVASGAGGALAEATSDFIPYAIVAAIAAATLLMTASRTQHPTVSSA